ncbi:Bgt-5181 [Blumeria graminis f. sp. tritici]|uniref:DASH complex subunit ASK1 n=2 Tax=Blumeria graminis f. sp. tritici TaxID=62690 RepID=A0A381LCW9_BLUGR|nr:DASH complex subunit Ask1 [Blumeria graminis f. sp. tritici 96224]VCU40676.1 Bgt-5181 [Blumeria graminis f. sp. tritici]
MSRASSVRSTSLTEELDKLEQSITLTLQEIDQNFSRAHQVVTSSILPIVEKYSEHSSAFWKQFFEASANVSLSGIEEQENGEVPLSVRSQDYPNSYAGSSSENDDTTINATEELASIHQSEDSILDNPEITGSTPRAPQQYKTNENLSIVDNLATTNLSKIEPTFVKMGTFDEKSLPKTPNAKATVPYKSTVPAPSPFDFNGLPLLKPSADPILHRILDKNYRLQVTPHKSYDQKRPTISQPIRSSMESPMSSPLDIAPQLHLDLFSSPIKPAASKSNAPRTPGISVQTPAKGRAENLTFQQMRNEEISWESDSEEDAEGVYRELGMSPPKTIQFNLPTSRLLQTPAREASQRIVHDLLAMAGAESNDSSMEYSPNIVAKREIEDAF